MGIGQQVRRERFIHRVRERNKQHDPPSNASATEPLPSSTVDLDYHISVDTRQNIQLHQWLKENESDPALQVILTTTLF